MYNDQLLAIQGVLTNGALRTLAYPAKEFSFWSYPHSFNTSSATSVSEEEEAEDDDGYYFQDYETSSSSSSATSGIPKVDWNSEESFASISESLAHFRLFYLASDFSNPISSVARLYDDYPIRMMNLPHVSRESLRMLTTDIWHYLLDHQGQGWCSRDQLCL